MSDQSFMLDATLDVKCTGTAKIRVDQLITILSVIPSDADIIDIAPHRVEDVDPDKSEFSLEIKIRVCGEIGLINIAEKLQELHVDNGDMYINLVVTRRVDFSFHLLQPGEVSTKPLAKINTADQDTNSDSVVQEYENADLAFLVNMMSLLPPDTPVSCMGSSHFTVIYDNTDRTVDICPCPEE